MISTRLWYAQAHLKVHGELLGKAWHHVNTKQTRLPWPLVRDSFAFSRLSIALRTYLVIAPK